MIPNASVELLAPGMPNTNSVMYGIATLRPPNAGSTLWIKSPLYACMHVFCHRHRLFRFMSGLCVCVSMNIHSPPFLLHYFPPALLSFLLPFFPLSFFPSLLPSFPPSLLHHISYAHAHPLYIYRYVYIGKQVSVNCTHEYVTDSPVL